MSYRLRRNGRNGSLTVTFSGDVSPADLLLSQTDSAAAVRKWETTRLLVDFRGCVPKFTMEDAFGVTASHARVFPPGTRVAMLVPEGKFRDFADFAVTVARNRGFAMQVFPDARAANRWLAG